jgi:hypothetical protein
MMIRWALVKVDDPTGPIYSGVMASEPWEAEDNLLVFAEVSYLKAYSFLMIGSF